MSRQEEKNKAQGISSSSISSALNATAIIPLAIGAGIAGHNIYKTKSKNISDLFTGTAASAVSEVQDLLRHIKGPGTVTSYRALGERIKSLNVSKEMPTENIRAIWENAARAITDETLRSKIRGQMGVETDPQRMLTAIGEMFHGGSIQTRRAGLRFLSGISTLQGGLNANEALVSLPSLTPSPTRKMELSRFKRMKALAPLTSGIEAFEQELGATVQRIGFQRRAGLIGKTLKIEFGLPTGAELKLNIPVAHRGMVTLGGTQYIVGAFGVLSENRIKSTMKYEEWVMRHAQSYFIPKIRAMTQGGKRPSSWELEGLVREFESEIREPLEYIETALGRSPSDPIKRFGVSVLHLTDSYGNLDWKDRAKDVENLMRSGRTTFPDIVHPVTRKPISLYPYSPNRLRHATFMTEDPARFATLPEMFPYSKRPGQALRGFAATEQARGLMGPGSLTARYTGFVGEAFRETGEELRTPAGRTIYTARPISGLKEGMFYISTGMREQLQVERLRNIALRADPEALTGAKSVLEMLEETEQYSGIYRLKAGASGIIKKGTFLGLDPEGEALRAESELRLTGAVASEGKFRLVGLEQAELGQASKYFGDYKGVGMYKTPGEMLRESHAELTDYLMHMETLKKTRALHNKQMITALTEMNYDNMKSFKTGKMGTAGGKFPAVVSAEFDPAQLLSTVRGMETEEILPHLISTAKNLGVTSRQAGLIFGAVPYVRGVEYTQEAIQQLGQEVGFDPSWAAEIARGRAMGIAHIFSAGPPSLTGAGTSMASIEPRIFDIIRGGQFGAMEENIFQDLATRRLMTDPEAVLARNEFEHSLLSLDPNRAAAVPPKGAQVFDIAKGGGAFDPRDPAWIGRQGGYVNLGKLGGPLYVPGQGAIKQLAEYRTPEDKIIQTDITHAYANFLEEARITAREGSKGDISAARDRLSDALIKAHRATITGKGGLARGGLVGSRFFAGIATSTMQADADIFRVGVSGEYFGKMFEELKLAADLRTDKDVYLSGLEEMRTRFFKGEEIGGYLIRHPFIGQYSLQSVRYYRDKSLSDALVKIPTVERKFVVNGRTVSVNWSTAVGMGGDYDADIYGAILADPRHEMGLREMSRMGTPYVRDYESFAIRHQMLGLKKVTEEAGEKAAIAARKMAVTERIGEISFEMSRARAALIAHGGRGAAAANANFLLEWFEQNPISGKHLTAEQIGMLNPQISDIVSSIRENNMERLKNVFTEMADPERLAMLSKSTIAEEVLPRGTGRQVQLQGLNIEEAFETLGKSMRMMEETSELSAMREYSMTRGKSSIFTVGDIAPYLGAYERTALASMVNPVERGMMAGFSRKTMGLMGGLAAGLMENKRAIGLGLAGSLAVAAIMSAPRRSLGPIGEPTLNADMKGNMGDSVNRQNIHPDSPAMGQPTSQRMPQGPAPVQMNQPGMSAMVRVRGRMPGQFNPNNLNNSVRNALGPGTSAHTRVSDDRSIMTAHSINDIISR